VSTLGGRQRRFLRARGHALASTVQVGKDGLTEALLQAVDAALLQHELIKVKLGQGAGLDRHQAAEALSARTRSELVQVLGNTILLYRRNEEEPRIELPT
jgi:RNA-binding protein